MKKIMFIMLILVFAGILFWQCGSEKSEPLSGDMAEHLAYFPGSGTGLGYINVEKMRTSPFFEQLWQSNREKMMNDEEYREFTEATGFDVTTDVEEIYITLAHKSDTHKNFLAAVYGKYKDEKILDYLRMKKENEKFTEENYQQFAIYHLPKGKNSFSFPNSRTFLFGSTELVKQWLDKYAAETRSVPSEWQKRLKSVKYKNGAYFIVNTETIASEVSEHLQKHPEAKPLAVLKDVKEVNFSIDVADRLRFDGTGNFATNEQSQLFYDAVKGFLAAAKLTVSNDRDAVDVLNKIQIKQDGQSVRVQFDFTKEEADKIFSQQNKFAKRW